MNISNKGISLIKTLEGFRAKAYKDSAGLSTIGYGHKITDDKHLLEAILTEEAATELLLKDIKGFENHVNEVCSKYQVELNQNQFDALVSFTFNTGAFRPAMLKRFKAQDVNAIGKALTLYNKIGSHTSIGLDNRRKQEQERYFS